MFDAECQKRTHVNHDEAVRTPVGSDTWVEFNLNSTSLSFWYDQYAGHTPELQAFARIILAQPASASICERINSEFAFVKDRRRNKLAHEKANKLVGLFHNLRLLARMNKTEYAEPAVGWLEDNDTKTGIKKWGIANYM